MKQIVDTYKKEAQIFINDENEFIPSERTLTATGQDLQEALVMQRRRLRKYGLKLLCKEKILKSHKQEGEYLKEYSKDTRRYIFQSGYSKNISGIVKKTYCVKDDTDVNKKVTFVEMKDFSLQPYIQMVKKYLEYYFDIENVKAALTDFKYMFIGILLTFVLAFLSSGLNYYFNNNRPISMIAWGWPIPSMWVILAIVLIILNKPGIKKKSSHTTLLLVQKSKPDFSPEKFIAMAESRLKCIYFADTQEEIGAFAESDLSSFLNRHKDVVNCELTDFVFNNFIVNANYMYMMVEQKVILDCNRQGYIKQQKETVVVSFMKVRNGIMSGDFYHDWYVTDVDVIEDNWDEYEG